MKYVLGILVRRPRKTSLHPRSRLKRKHTTVIAFFLAILGAASVLLFIGTYDTDLLFILAVAPSSYLLWHFYHADKYKHESLRLLFGTFAIGAAMSSLAWAIESGYSQPSLGSGILFSFLYFLLGVGLVEEITKYLSVVVYAYSSIHFDEPMDGIILGVAASLGFATVENIFYVFAGGVETALIRAIVSVPGHAFWGAIMGFYLGEAKVRRRSILVVQGLATVVLLHGISDTALAILPDLVGIAILAAFVWLIYYKVVRNEIRKAEAESPYKESAKRKRIRRSLRTRYSKQQETC